MMKAGAWLALGAVAVLGLARGRRGAIGRLARGLDRGERSGWLPPVQRLHLLRVGGVARSAVAGRAPAPGRAGCGRAAGLLGGVALGALLAAAQLLPTLEMSGLGTRSLEKPLDERDAIPSASKRGSFSDTALELLSGEGRRPPPAVVWLRGARACSLRAVERTPSRSGLGDARARSARADLRRGACDAALRSLPSAARVRLVPDTQAKPLRPGLLLRRGRGAGSRRDPPTCITAGRRLLAGRQCPCGRHRVAGAGQSSSWPTPSAPGFPTSARDTRRSTSASRPIYSVIAASPQRVFFWSSGLAPALPSKLASIFGMRAVDDYEPMSLRRQAEYFGFLQTGSTKSRTPGLPFYGRLSQSRAYSRAGRRAGNSPAPVRPGGHALPARPGRVRAQPGAARLRGRRGSRAQTGFERKALLMFENPRALPRAYVTYRARPAPPA